MDKLLAPHSPEAAAYSHITENVFDWQSDQPSVDESLISGCASYRAFDRYLSGNDMVFPPRTPIQLESTLRRYAYDAIHNAISSSKSQLQVGGYSRVCHLAEKSIRDVLNTGDNVNILLALHSKPTSNSIPSRTEGEETNTRTTPNTTRLR